MKQILHIFRKDVRRHWPEILVGLALVAMFTWATLQGLPRVIAYNRFLSGLFSRQAVPLFLLLFWIFLALRVVHGEPLVGDRQWWVTKPYEWWKLVAAKELFLVTFLCGPLFLAQLYLLHAANFSVFTNLAGVLGMQVGLAVVLIIPAAALGSLTRNLAQALIGIVFVVASLWGIFRLLELTPNSDMSFAVDGSSEVTGILVLASICGALGWQYARRKIWASRGLLVGGITFVVVLCLVTPYQWFVEKNYPLVKEGELPARVSVVPIKLPARKRNRGYLPTDNVSLSLPIQISGVLPGHVVVLKAVEVSADLPDGRKWDAGWRPQWTDIWPGDKQENVRYETRSSDYQTLGWENLRLHVQLLLVDHQGAGERDLVLREGRFADPALGNCHLNLNASSQLDCQRPFRDPSLMATLQPGQADCSADDSGDEAPETAVTHAWFPPIDDDSPGPGLNPVNDYQIYFGSRPWQTNTSGRKLLVVRLCPGTIIKMSSPQRKAQIRVAVDVPGVRLADLAENLFSLD